MELAKQLAAEFNLQEIHSENIISLIDEGNTIPFIARYRKEMHNSCDDQVLREFADRLTYLRNLAKRKEEVFNSVTEQGKMTEEVAAALERAQTLTEVEDVYRPFKQKKKTRASVAIEKGLQPLADLIYAQQTTEGDISELAAPFVNAEKGVENSEQALKGAADIIAEMISDDAELRKSLREFLKNEADISTKQINPEKEEGCVYEMYADHSEKIAKIPAHRVLAINRGEKEECLKVGIVEDREAALAKVKAAHVKGDSIFRGLLEATAEDAYDRLIFPSIEREVRNELTDMANEQAIKMFEVNLRPLLMQPPLKGKTILAVDPAYRTGCKIAVIDPSGNVLDTGVVYPTPPQNRVEEAKAKLKAMIKKHGVDVISIGNGTASKEAEIFVAELIKECDARLSYAVVNEAGASVYSASKLGAQEFPEFDVSIRSAVSIARRLQDPLAELIKIDVKSIGVGQYQHDMPQKRLTEVLEGVVEDCVNSVGVDLNTASPSLLSYVAGLNSAIAKNIAEYRKTAPFTDRSQLLKVNKLGAKAFEQCAGFLRIPQGENVLDNTAVHPEAYGAVEKLLAHFGLSVDDVKSGGLKELPALIEKEGRQKVAELVGVGEFTLDDIVNELLKPGRDIRDSLPTPVLRSDLLDIKDLKPGMELDGVVRNVIDFGVFVDIGVHQDGLVHISQIADGYIKHPSDILSVGETVHVKVLDVDVKKNKISLTMKTSLNPFGKKPKEERKPRAKDDKRRDFKAIRQERKAKEEAGLEQALKRLQQKYGRK